MLGKWPNTYVYTKAVAEEIIRLSKNKFPIGISRPAIGKFYKYLCFFDNLKALWYY